MLLLISQRLSAGIILRWLCSVSSRRVGGCECLGGYFSDPHALPWRVGASLLWPGAGEEKNPQHEACAGRRRRESQGRRMLLGAAGKDCDGHFGTWLLSSSPSPLCLPVSVALVKAMGATADTTAPAPGSFGWQLGAKGGSIGARHGISPAAAVELGQGSASAHVLPFPPSMADGSPSAQPSCATSPIFSSCVFFPTGRGPRQRRKRDGADQMGGRKRAL